MEAKPVKQNRVPVYPTRRQFLTGAGSVVLISLTGAGIVGGEGKGKGITVAPVFEHGNGRGAAGCVVVSPPVFLSEEEGMQVLKEEFAKHGIKLKSGGVLESVHLPRSLMSAEEAYRDLLESLRNELKGLKEGSETPPEDIPQRITPFKVDGLDSDKRIAVEFVSQKNYPGEPGSWSSVRDYNFRDVAQKIASTVKEQGKDDVFFAVFYDPVSKRPDGTRESHKLLRQQAQDFVAWLKQENAIP